MRVAAGVLRTGVRSGVLTRLVAGLACGGVLAAAIAVAARADEMVLYLGETDPRPLEVDGRPADSLPMIRFEIGALDATGARRVTVHELRALEQPLSEVAGASAVTDSRAGLRSPSPGLIRLALTLQAAERWDTSFDLVPRDDDGRVSVVARGSEVRSDGLAPRTFRHELSGWFLAYPEEKATSDRK